MRAERCDTCGHALIVSRRCRRRACPSYSAIWAGDHRQKLFRCLEQVKLTLLGAVTAPGADVLPWDEDWCAALGPHKHSGELGCRVDQQKAWEWNRTASERWSKLHRAAARRARRAIRPAPGAFSAGRGSEARSASGKRRAWCDRSPFLGRVWQLQRRGVLHVHPVLDVSSPRKAAWSRAYLDALRELAPRYGFGFSQGKQWAQARSGIRSAAYLASYLVRGKGRAAAIGEVVQAAPMVRHVSWLSPHLSRGIFTVREFRFRRFVWVMAQRWGVAFDVAYEVLVELVVGGKAPVSDRSPPPVTA